MIEPDKDEAANNKWDLDTRLLTQIFETAINPLDWVPKITEYLAKNLKPYLLKGL